MKALTGLQIFKYLPGGKKEKEANCKKCGFPTCMAFAMKLAKKEVTLDKCEFVSEELKEILEEASQVQQQQIKFGTTEDQVVIGGETVMFRHDKTFINPACIAVKLDSSDPDFDAKLNEIKNYSVERVGEIFKINAVALVDSGSLFVQSAKKINELNIPVILVSSSVENVREALSIIKDSIPLVFLKDADINESIKIEKEYKVPVVLSAGDVESLADISAEALDNEAENLVLNIETVSSKDLIQNLTYIRRSAIENKFKPLGFPVISFMDGYSENIIDEAIWSSVLMCKYSNIIVLNDFNKALIYSLLTLRQNIYTDPQKPLQIEAKVYPIGEVNADSPVVVTTNFALTYFSVVSEIESSGVSSYLVITSSDGMSVLTAWAASKFTGETIAKAIKESNIENKLNHKSIIIPGYVGNLKIEIEEELPGWEVIIGPNEADEILDFLKKQKYSLKK